MCVPPHRTQTDCNIRVFEFIGAGALKTIEWFSARPFITIK